MCNCRSPERHKSGYIELNFPLSLISKGGAMLGFGTHQKGRASECWGADLISTDVFPASAPLGDLDADEYIFPHRSPPACDVVSAQALLSHCRNALCAAVDHAWFIAPDASARQQILDTLKAIPIEEALDLGRAVRGDWYASKRTFSSRTLFKQAPRLQRLELDAIESLDTLVAVVTAGKRLELGPLGLMQVAFHAALNPVVVCDEAIAITEGLSVSAWLGLLHRGRRVVMPGFVSAYWSMLLDGHKAWLSSDYLPDAFLLDRAASMFDFDDFSADVISVATEGPRLIRPARWRTIRLVQ